MFSKLEFAMFTYPHCGAYDVQADTLLIHPMATNRFFFCTVSMISTCGENLKNVYPEYCCIRIVTINLKDKNVLGVASHYH